MHNLDTNLNFHIILTQENSQAFSRGEFTSFQTNTKFMYPIINTQFMCPISSRIQFANSADTLSVDVFRRTTQANSLTALSLSTCEWCNNKHTAIQRDIN
jgi:hypothetical protein